MLVIDRYIKSASGNTLNHYAKCIFHPCRLQKHTLNKWHKDSWTEKKPNYENPQLFAESISDWVPLESHGSITSTK